MVEHVELEQRRLLVRNLATDQTGNHFEVLAVNVQLAIERQVRVCPALDLGHKMGD